MKNKYSRGSEWRKWDLHVHTPSSHLNNNFKSCEKNDFVQKCLDEKISVIGLTNYFKFSDDDFDLKENLEKKNITVFLNLELRLTYQNKDDKCCDLHIIFSNELSKDDIKQFLSNLTVGVDGNGKKANNLSSQEDFKSATVEFEHLLEELNEESLDLKDKYLLGFLSRGHGNSRSSSQYESLSKKCDFIIHSSDEQKNIKEDIQFWLKYNKPLLQSSDAHELNNIGTKFTWIKSDPTFEGLQQIIYEPEERVRIQTENPSFEFDKPFFEKVKIAEDVEIFENESTSFVKFVKNESILLNKNLVTFIGGRGAGKSLFLKYVGSRFPNVYDKGKVSLTKSNNFIVNYQKENKENGEAENFEGIENNLDFVFIEQSKIKNITEGEGLKNEIKKLLWLEDLGFNQKLNSEIDKNKQSIQSVENWLHQKDEEGNEINTKQHHKKIKTENEKLLATIKTESNKQKLERYTKNIKETEKIKNQLDRIDNFRNKLSLYKRSLNKDIEVINKFYDDKKLKLSVIDFENTLQKLKSQERFLTDQKEEKERGSSTIKKSFEEGGFKGDLIALLANARIYQEKIEKADKQINIILSKEKELKNLKK